MSRVEQSRLRGSVTERGAWPCDTTNRFTALDTEMDKVHEMFEEVLKALDDLRNGMRRQTITLSVTIIVAFLGQPAMARYLPPPALPAPRIIIQSPAG